MTTNLCTVKEIAQLLGVSPKTVYSWAELQQIPHVKLNGALRFSLPDVLQWVDSCKRATKSVIIPEAQTVAVPRKGV